jgi:hypothetical protein
MEETMKETINAYQRKSLVKTRDTFIATKQTTEQQPLVGKLAESNLSTLQKQASHPSLRSVEKRKKYYIPFTALALVLTLSSLCAFALLGHLSSVQARETLLIIRVSSAFPTLPQDHL